MIYHNHNSIDEAKSARLHRTCSDCCSWFRETRITCLFVLLQEDFHENHQPHDSSVLKFAPFRPHIQYTNLNVQIKFVVNEIKLSMSMCKWTVKHLHLRLIYMSRIIIGTIISSFSCNTMFGNTFEQISVHLSKIINVLQ